MRTAAISYVVIALALASIVAGFLGGASSRPPAIVTLRPQSPPPMDGPGASRAAALERISDAAVIDAFSNDDVVIDRPVLSATNWFPPRLSFVIGIAGQSVLVDAQFLRLGVPLAFDVDASEHDASALAELAHRSGDAIYVHLDAAPTRTQLSELRERLGGFEGVASRDDTGMAQALHDTGLTFFDELGSADRAAFARAHVRFVARDVTVDNHTSRSYIDYMLERAAMRSRREGRLVALMRPQPSTLHALTQFVTTSSAQIVGLR